MNLLTIYNLQQLFTCDQGHAHTNNTLSIAWTTCGHSCEGKKLQKEFFDIFFFTHEISRMLAMGHANDVGSDKDR